MNYKKIVIFLGFVLFVSGCVNYQASSQIEDDTSTPIPTEVSDPTPTKVSQVVENTPTPTELTQENPTPTNTPEETTIHIIEMTNSGYIPNSLTINVGDTVKFDNTGTRLIWPASAQHPTHTTYPGSSIQKCGTFDESGIFDACKGIQEGESFEFTFNEVGQWFYHDHLRTSNFGSVTVE